MLRKIFATRSLYFSHEYNLSQSFQRYCQKSFSPVPNEHFAFNFPLMGPLADQGFSYWRPVFISGCVLIKYCRLSSSSDCNFLLISRRDHKRSGMRFFQRGADEHGNTSNFAETEQIIILDNKDSQLVYSFVQTRGSMPFAWQQTPNLKWNPKATVLGDKQYNIECCKKHFTEQQTFFGKQTIINLIDKKGT